MADKHDDPVKKIFGKTAEELFTIPIVRSDKPHADFHSPNAFCGSAGPQELKHFHSLLARLTNKQIAMLATAVGTHFYNVSNEEADRDELEGILEEVDREDFYREYHKIVDTK